LITPVKEYRSAMERYNKEVADLQGLIREKQGERTPYRRYIDYGFSLIGQLPEYYDNAGLEVKHKILGSMFPEKLRYSDKSFRTTPQNSVLSLLLQASNELQRSENKKVGENADQSSMAPPAGLEPATL
jgi:site-specific DNA recombinase